MTRCALCTPTVLSPVDAPFHCHGSADYPERRGVYKAFRCECECRGWRG